MFLPASRGPLSAYVIGLLHGTGEKDPGTAGELDVIDADFQLAFGVIADSHLRGYEDAVFSWESLPELPRLYDVLCSRFEQAAELATGWQPPLPDPTRGPQIVRDYVQTLRSGPAVSAEQSEMLARGSDVCFAVIPRLPADVQVSGLRAVCALRAHAGGAVGEEPVRLSGGALALLNLASLYAIHRRHTAAAVGYLIWCLARAERAQDVLEVQAEGLVEEIAVPLLGSPSYSLEGVLAGLKTAVWLEAEALGSP